jgi:DNA polymerase-3 subunit epsilon
MERKIFNFDVETTGKYANVHGLTQIAGIIEINDKIVEKFHFKLKPYKTDKITREALDIQQITLKDILTYQNPSEVYEEIIEIFSKYINRWDPEDKFYPSGYNINFDISFLIEFFQKNNDEYLGSWIKLNAQIDPLYILRMLDFMGQIQLPNYKLETVAEALSIELTAHNPLSDIEATLKIRKIVEQLITC